MLKKQCFRAPVLLMAAAFAPLTFAPSSHANDEGLLAVAAVGAVIVAQGMNKDDPENAVSFVPSIGLQFKELSFDQKYSGVESNDAEFTTTLPVLSASLTMAYRKMFLALKYEDSFAETSTTVDETQAAYGASNLITIPGSETEVEREDKSVTLGYNVWNKLNLFVGYMEGSTTLTPDLACKMIIPSIPNVPYGDCLAGANRALYHAYLGGGDYEQVYTEKGPYIGASYAWSIADAGVLSASFAYAYMDGDYEDNMMPDTTGFFNGSIEPFRYSGDTTGTSIGLTWTAPLGESSSYFLDLRRQQYEMSASDDTGLALYNGTKLDSKETMQGFTAGLQFYF